jgi:hypothetical protein
LIIRDKNAKETCIKFMKKIALIVLLVICDLHSTTAQENSKQKSINFQTWIHLYNQQKPLRGVLYEIKDSSIWISNSMVKADYLTSNFKVSNIEYKNIGYVYLRNRYSVVIGTVIGTAVGIAGAFGIAGSIANKDELAGAMLLFGSPFIALGTGIGALIGSFRIHIPINGSFETFKQNESRLKRYSYLQEHSNGFNIYEKVYEHKWFIGLVLDLSLPSGDFEDTMTGTLKTNLAKTGGNGGFILGFIFKENFGLSASFLNSSYNIKNSTTDKWWSLTSFLAGPMFSVPVINSFFLDLKPMIGYTNASLNVGNTSEKSGNGFGIYPSASLRYNFSRRWCALVETGYLFSNQKFYDDIKKMQAINLGAGIAYRFK